MKIESATGENISPPLDPDMLKMKKSNNLLDYAMWLRMGDQDYVVTRLLVYCDLERLAAYHMQQAVEKYLKCFIVKHFHIQIKSTKKKNGKLKHIIEFYTNNSNKEIELKTHDLNAFLSCCQTQDNFFNDKRVIQFIGTLNKIDEIRYPSRLEINYEIFSYMDYFVKRIRDLIGTTNVIDLISHLHSGPVVGRDMVITCLEEAFFYKNEFFKKR